MKLQKKFNFLIFGAAISGLLILSATALYFLNDQARKEAIINANLLLNTMLAVREYTVSNVRPLIDQENADQFISESVPAFSAHSVIENLRKNYPEYSYREAVQNPTNPNDALDNWERNLVDEFKSDRSKKEIVKERVIDGTPYLTISKPIIITNPGCLSCHSTPEAAPEKLVEKYGSVGGFGWRLNEVLGVQTVRVPTAFSERAIMNKMSYFVGSFFIVFIVIAITFNRMFAKLINKPLSTLNERIHILSSGVFHNVAPIKFGTNDEIDTLAHGLSTLQINTAKRIRSLRTQARHQIEDELPGK